MQRRVQQPSGDESTQVGGSQMERHGTHHGEMLLIDLKHPKGYLSSTFSLPARSAPSNASSHPQHH